MFGSRALAESGEPARAGPRRAAWPSAAWPSAAWRWVDWLIPLLAAGAVYSRAPAAGFVWDDETVFGAQLGALDSLRDVFAPPPGIPYWQYLYYRPAVVLTYLLDRFLYGTAVAAGAHVTNVVLHAAATGLVFLLLRRLVGETSGSSPAARIAVVLAATLFAVHPIHTEAVSWIAGRSDLLATTLLLAGLVLVLRRPLAPDLLTVIASSLSFALALLAKETALAGLLILPTLLVLMSPDPKAALRDASARRVTAGWVVAALCYLGLRRAIGPAGGVPNLPGPADWTWVLQAAGYYPLRLVLPWPQSFLVTLEQLPSVGLSVAAVVAVAGAIVAATQRWRRTGHGLVLAGLLWFGAAIAPAFAVLFSDLAVTPVAERYLYLPSVGLSMVVAGLAASIDVGARRRAVVAVSAVVLGAYATLTVHRNTVWLSNERLWEATSAVAPNYSLPWMQLGKAYQRRGRAADAYAAFQRALPLERFPTARAIIYFNLGSHEFANQQLIGAEQSFASATVADPGMAPAYALLGRVRLIRGRLSAERGAIEEAVRQATAAVPPLTTAISISPTDRDVWHDLIAAMLLRADATAARGERLSAAQQYRHLTRAIDAWYRWDPTARSDAPLASVRAYAGSRQSADAAAR